MFPTHPPLFNFRSRIIDWFLVMDKRSKDGELVLIRALPRRSREIVFKCVKTQKMKSWMWSELCLEGQRVSPHGHAHPGGRVNHWWRPFGSVRSRWWAEIAGLFRYIWSSGCSASSNTTTGSCAASTARSSTASTRNQTFPRKRNLRSWEQLSVMSSLEWLTKHVKAAASVQTWGSSSV